MKRKMIITVMVISLSLLTVSCTKSVESKSISKDMISSTLESVIGGIAIAQQTEQMKDAEQ